jgi:hypothetical protein
MIYGFPIYSIICMIPSQNKIILLIFCCQHFLNFGDLEKPENNLLEIYAKIP